MILGIGVVDVHWNNQYEKEKYYNTLIKQVTT